MSERTPADPDAVANEVERLRQQLAGLRETAVHHAATINTILLNAPESFFGDEAPDADTAAVRYVRHLETRLAEQPAPELAAAMAETRHMRDLVAEILSHFGPTGSGHVARVGQIQIAKWRESAGLEDS